MNIETPTSLLNITTIHEIIDASDLLDRMLKYGAMCFVGSPDKIDTQEILDWCYATEKNWSKQDTFEWPTTFEIKDVRENAALLNVIFHRREYNTHLRGK